VYGSGIALILTIIYYMLRNVLKYEEVMNCLPLGFRNMVPAILILIFAWTLCEMTRGQLDSAGYVKSIVSDFGGNAILPALFMLIACFISFSTGTSWGTFGILLPIVLSVFEVGDPLMIVGVSACLAGSVFGDHCSPISDTTIMSSAGAQCNHIEHVSTQTPYAMIVAAISFAFFLLAGFWQSIIVTVLGIAATVAIFYILKKTQERNPEPSG
jgi:Na+/H+ antiporter NhaC